MSYEMHSVTHIGYLNLTMKFILALLVSFAVGIVGAFQGEVALALTLINVK